VELNWQAPNGADVADLGDFRGTLFTNEGLWLSQHTGSDKTGEHMLKNNDILHGGCTYFFQARNRLAPPTAESSLDIDRKQDATQSKVADIDWYANDDSDNYSWSVWAVLQLDSKNQPMPVLAARNEVQFRIRIQYTPRCEDGQTVVGAQNNSGWSPSCSPYNTSPCEIHLRQIDRDDQCLHSLWQLYWSPVSSRSLQDAVEQSAIPLSLSQRDRMGVRSGIVLTEVSDQDQSISGCFEEISSEKGRKVKREGWRVIEWLPPAEMHASLSSSKDSMVYNQSDIDACSLFTSDAAEDDIDGNLGWVRREISLNTGPCVSEATQTSAVECMHTLTPHKVSDRKKSIDGAWLDGGGSKTSIADGDDLIYDMMQEAEGNGKLAGIDRQITSTERTRLFHRVRYLEIWHEWCDANGAIHRDICPRLVLEKPPPPKILRKEVPELCMYSPLLQTAITMKGSDASAPPFSRWRENMRL
jgi:hypothetical protein